MSEDLFNLQSKRILITGASLGIGRATAIAAARQGASVVAVARHRERLDNLVSELPGAGHLAAPFDLNDSDAIVSFVQAITADSRPLSGIVHSAGIQRAKPLRVTKADDFALHERLNATAAGMLLAAVARRGVAAPECSVVLISSVMGELGAAGLTAYCASKAALTGLVRAAALELAGARIRVNAILPGVVETEMSRRHLASLGEEHLKAIERMHPLGFGTADDVAAAAVFLLSDAARWITGTSMFVDGGYSAH